MAWGPLPNYGDGGDARGMMEIMEARVAAVERAEAHMATMERAEAPAQGGDHGWRIAGVGSTA